MITDTYSEIKQNLLNKVLIVLGIAATPVIAFSVFRVATLGWQPVFLIHICLIPIIIFFAIYRERIPFDVKIAYVLALFFSVAILAFLNFGLSGHGIEYLMLSILVALVFWGRKSALSIFGAGIISLSIISVLSIMGIVVPKITTVHYYKEFSTWANGLVSFSILMGIMILVVGNIGQLLNIRLLELRRINDELQGALEQIKTLQGIVPICSSCKKIRDDEGYWHQVEVYIRDHTDAEFSHGICPKCMQKLYPEFCK